MFNQTLHNGVHFIGIGGISMSALADILLSQKVAVSGSDAVCSDITDRLSRDGAKITIGQSADNIESPGLVVYTAAISPDNPELMRARELGIETMERADFLGKLMLDYKYPISVSGTHGKTTTTSMLSCVFLQAGLDPTVLVGGEFAQIGSNYHIGKKNHLIFEGCEYVDSFLRFNPYAAIILNVDADHLDYFSGIEQIKQSFNKFLKLLPENGFAVMNADDKNSMECLDGVKCEIITCGKNGMYHAENITDCSGCCSFDLYCGKEKRIRIDLSVPGLHNVGNALSVYACSERFGLAPEIISEGITSFHGAKRRFEYKGMLNGARVYDDYAHHPTEIAATIATARKLNPNRLWCVFQPHTYSRTNALLNEFAAVMSECDRTIITDIYAAREKNTIGISGKDLADKIKAAEYIGGFDKIADKLKTEVCEGDLVMTVGAGTITELSQLLF